MLNSDIIVEWYPVSGIIKLDIYLYGLVLWFSSLLNKVHETAPKPAPITSVFVGDYFQVWINMH